MEFVITNAQTYIHNNLFMYACIAIYLYIFDFGITVYDMY